MNHPPHGKLPVPTSALLGGVVWGALAAGSLAGRIDLGTIELLLLLAPLVIVPLGLELSARLEIFPQSSSLERYARHAQFLGAPLAAASFWLLPGGAAASLASAWALVCGLLGTCGLLRLFRGGIGSLDAACGTLALIYLPVGGAWFVASRAGFSPLGFQEPIVLLTAIHFHYAGFAAPLIARATSSPLSGSSGAVRRIFRLVAVGVLACPGLLAAGFIIGPRIKLAAALLLAVSQVGLAICVLAALGTVQRWLAKTLLAFSAGSAVFAMVLAGIWAVGEYPLQPFVNLPQMARLHGIANGFGFVLCGLLGWSVVAAASLGDKQ